MSLLDTSEGLLSRIDAGRLELACGLTEFLAKKGLYASETERGNDMSQESWKEKGFSAEDWPCETAILLDVTHVPVFSIAAGVYPRWIANAIESLIFLVEKESTGP